MEDIRFYFKWVDQQGNEEWKRRPGAFDGETLKLDNVEIPVLALVQVVIRGSRMAFSVALQDQPAALLVVGILSNSIPAKLKKALDLARSRVWADARREQLEAEGRGHEFRAWTCPHCEGTVDLTSMEETPQVYCRLCDSISTLAAEEALLRSERQFRLCDECGMYSKPRKFTIFYFFLYAAFHKETWRCPACMRGDAWKMLAGNSIFLLGVPVALAQLYRSYGGTDRGSIYPNLDRANLKARGGKLEDAIADYRQILDEHVAAAGVMHNIGLAFLKQDDTVNAARTFELALRDCSNYQPAASALANCYEKLGETVKLAELKTRWGVGEQEEDE